MLIVSAEIFAVRLLAFRNCHPYRRAVEWIVAAAVAVVFAQTPAHFQSLFWVDGKVALIEQAVKIGTQQDSSSLESSLFYSQHRDNPSLLCSTPFGIIGIFTAAGGTLERAHASAQRLSASLESSLFALNNSQPPPLVCSTPFGIIGIFTRRPRATASTSPSAQRLSASLESSHDHLDVLVREILVLNAFRHHWNLHARRRSFPARPRRSVLNAFRHHWNLHPSARPPSRRVSRAQRLSASLESSLGFDGFKARATARCSTPFGIIGIFTRSTCTSSTSNSSAQRLSASLESSPRRSSASPTRPRGAQRLSASLESSLPRLLSRSQT